MDERPKMEQLMKENIKWEVLEAKHNLDMLKAEKAKYELKLEHIYAQCKVRDSFLFSLYHNPV